ncbi:uncharacterized protein BDV17DRAFT_260806 [Aspergillus undulatus]|uniref:uncharacterized protein n=1 Tax=Aspergillus undulatus TaxID=1810928 RepID=UPI003CCD790E
MADPQPPQGIPDEDLWRLIRRFDKQVSHVQAIPKSNVQALDLNRAPAEQFPAAKLQKTIERFYVSVVVKCGLLLNHVNQLRSWREPRRTGAFGAVYLIAWLCDLLIPTITASFMAMIFVPPARTFLFPPLPKTVTESGSKKEETKPVHTTSEVNSEEADQEASAFVGGLTTTIAEGADEPVQAETAELGDIEVPGDGTDEAGKPKTSPAISVTMKVLSDITDLSERVSNLLAPSPPFSLLGPRFQVAMILISVILVSMALSSNMIVKTISLTIGLIFFGDPVLSRGMAFLNEKIPNWKEYLDIEKTLLKGVPTNAQLTLTLLRMGELNGSPLPVPPPPGIYKNEYPSQWQLWRRKTKSIKDTESEVLEQDNENNNGDNDKDSTSLASTSQTDLSSPSSASGKNKVKAKGKKWLRVLRFARRAITTALKGQVAYNRALGLAGAGSKFYAKGLISAVLERNINLLMPPPSLSQGPHTFEAKFERKRGTAVIDSSPSPFSASTDEEDGTGPILYFTSRSAAKLDMDDLRVDAQKTDSVMFRIPIASITELRKTEGLGWKGKLIVQLAGGEEAGNEGLVVRGGKEGEEQTFHLTDIQGRNQLFNRLVAGGVQCWEMY